MEHKTSGEAFAMKSALSARQLGEELKKFAGLQVLGLDLHRVTVWGYKDPSKKCWRVGSL